MDFNKALFGFIRVAFSIMIALLVLFAGIKICSICYDFGYRVFTEPAMTNGDGQDVLVQVEKGISAICMHTNLDAAEGGVNEVLAGIFGMRDWKVFADGCGRVGEVEPITVPELARKAQAVLGGRCNRPRSGPAVQVKFADTGRTVKRLAVISGAGGSMFEDALAVGADCLLTGEANHHAAIDAVRLGLSLVAAGHYATEFPVCAAIADRLRTAFPELEVRVSGENRDPFTYI